jgi:hypothetical protein
MKSLKQFITDTFIKKSNVNNRKLILLFKIWYQLREEIEILYWKQQQSLLDSKNKSIVSSNHYYYYYYYLNFDLLENIIVEQYEEETEFIKYILQEWLLAFHLLRAS